MDIALFDFDGTITGRDMFTDFLYFAASQRRLSFGKALLAPVKFAYMAKLISSSYARRVVVRYGFSGMSEITGWSKGRQFCNDHIEQFVKTEAMEKLAWHQSRGDKIVIVSASLELYLKPWCENQNIDLICTKLCSREGYFTGAYRGKDCTGLEKVCRIQQRYNLEEYGTVYAYGDTSEDMAMLDLADEKYYNWHKIK